MPSLLRLITCGSVDDGKSTLIGRLMSDTQSVPEDRLQGLTDLSLLADGLEAERAQGITIDVAHIFFGTAKRRFILADTPGHEQYTRNMATGASTADRAIVLVDATKGILTQTRRHLTIARLLGIRTFVLAVNKMDLVGFSQGIFESIKGEFGRIADALKAGPVTAIPLSALRGDNIARRSEASPWYEGPTLLDFLEQVEPRSGSPMAYPAGRKMARLRTSSPTTSSWIAMAASASKRAAMSARRSSRACSTGEPPGGDW